MSGADRIFVDTSSITAQVQRIRGLCTDLGHLIGDLDAVRGALAGGWNDPAGHAYMSTLDSLQTRLRNDIQEIQALPAQFTAWIKQWQAAIDQAIKAAGNLPG